MAIGLKTLRTLSGHVVLGIPEVEMAGAALQIDQDDALGFAEAGAAVDGVLGGELLQAEQVLARLMPRTADPPTRSRSRRVTPSQVSFPARPGITSMGGTSRKEGERSGWRGAFNVIGHHTALCARRQRFGQQILEKTSLTERRHILYYYSITHAARRLLRFHTGGTIMTTSKRRFLWWGAGSLRPWPRRRCR